MTTLARVAAAATVTAGLGLGLAVPASAADVTPGPSPLPFAIPCAEIGGVPTAYPPGSCTYNFTLNFGGFSIPIIIVGNGDTVSFKIGNLPPFTIVFGYFLGQNSPPVQATTDANGEATLQVPASSVPAGDQQLTVTAGGNEGTVSVPAAVLAPSVAAAQPGAAAASGGSVVPAGATGSDDSTQAVQPASFTEVNPASVPSSDHTGAYAVAGGVLIGAVALSGGVAARRRKQN